GGARGEGRGAREGGGAGSLSAATGGLAPLTPRPSPLAPISRFPRPASAGSSKSGITGTALPGPGRPRRPLAAGKAPPSAGGSPARNTPPAASCSTGRSAASVHHSGARQPAARPAAAGTKTASSTP